MNDSLRLLLARSLLLIPLFWLEIALFSSLDSTRSIHPDFGSSSLPSFLAPADLLERVSSASLPCLCFGFFLLPPFMYHSERLATAAVKVDRDRKWIKRFTCSIVVYMQLTGFVLLAGCFV